MPIAITLVPVDLTLGGKVGSRRQFNCLAAGAVHRNNRPRNDGLDLINHQDAAIAELAAHYGLGTRHWNALADVIGQRKAPDLDGFIDVKQRHAENHHLIVPLDAVWSWAYVSVCSACKPTYLIDKWCWGDEIIARGTIKQLQPGRPAYCARMDAPFMQDAVILRALVAKRNGA